MKNIILLSLLVLILISSISFAAELKKNQGSSNNSSNANQTGEQIQTGQNTQNQGEDTGLTTQEHVRNRAENKEELKQMIKDMNQELKEKLKELKEQQKEREEHHNQVRLAVHALLSSENLTGGIGPNVSSIAKQFNNSAQATFRAEERIQNRNKLIRYCFGGDDKSADEIQEEVGQNQQKIQELNRLLNECDCDQELKNILQEQINAMEQEQERLQQLAQNEKSYKGLFGWLWK